MGIFRSSWEKLRRQFIEDVPADEAICEFDCRKAECQEGEWDTCERRAKGTAPYLASPPDSSPAAGPPAT